MTGKSRNNVDAERRKVRKVMKMNAEMKKVMVKDFADAKTYEEIKKIYVEYVQKFKDNGSALKLIDAALNKYVDGVKDKHVTAEGKGYTAPPKDNIEEFVALVGELMSIEGVVVEQIGTWLWVSGTTLKDDKDKRERVKEFGFYFSKKNAAWYKAPEGTSRRRSSGWSMDKKREKFGTHVLETAGEVAE